MIAVDASAASTLSAVASAPRGVAWGRAHSGIASTTAASACLGDTLAAASCACAFVSTLATLAWHGTSIRTYTHARGTYLLPFLPQHPCCVKREQEAASERAPVPVHGPTTVTVRG